MLLIRHQWSPVTGALANVIDWLIEKKSSGEVFKEARVKRTMMKRIRRWQLAYWRPFKTVRGKLCVKTQLFYQLTYFYLVLYCYLFIRPFIHSFYWVADWFIYSSKIRQKLLSQFRLFTVQCYAEHGYATVSRLSIRLSVCPWRLGMFFTQVGILWK